MANLQHNPLYQVETTCGSLLCELKIIWDEVGEPEAARDRMLYELEQECLDLYRRKVDQANQSRAQIKQAIADSEAELAAICSAIGELPVHVRQAEQKAESLKGELNTILPQLEEMRKRKVNRKNQFLEVTGQIQKLSSGIYGSADSSNAVVNENDLSLRRLEELQTQLQSLQKEKGDRLKLIKEHLSVLSSLCSVLGLDLNETVSELHPSLAGSPDTHNISSDTLQQLETATLTLHKLKLQRMQRLQDLATMLLEIWNLMDTPVEEQQAFQNVTCNIAASEDEITGPNMLSEDFIKYVETEVSRLEELKSSKLKELVLKKKAELEEICRKTHLVPESDGETEHLIEAIESGTLDPASVLEQFELEIGKVKEEAFSRKEILERVEKWLSAREEEEWLEDYNNDGNRYHTGKGSHLILKRAEKARTLVTKLPGMVEAMTAKVESWENERGVEFLYDGIHLLSMLEEYITLRQEKEQEKKRQREQKKLQGQLIAEQEVLFGSKPSPLKNLKKSSRLSMGGGSRRVSVGGNGLQTPRPASSQSGRGTPNARHFKTVDNTGGLSTARRAVNIANLPVKNFSFSGRESENSVSRRPFSPISNTASARANDDMSYGQNTHDTNQQQTHSKNETSQKIVSCNTPSTTASKMTPAADEENRTPKVMQTSTTPAPPPQPCYEHDVVDEEEYSFEERRAGFVLPNTHLKRAIHV